jgi:hypothetical protein
MISRSQREANNRFPREEPMVGMTGSLSDYRRLRRLVENGHPARGGTAE